MQFSNQVAVITGGASGMGAETAKQLTQAGMRVAILDRNLAQEKQTAQLINGIAITCDVTNSSDVTQAFAQIEAELGVPRVCVNCAGICPGQLIVGKDGSPLPLEDFTPTIQVNLIGTFNVLRVAAARMATLPPIGDSEERGVIINTASVAAFEGQIGQIAYSASKGGVVAMTLPAARELARFGIRVMAIAPGLIETPMLRGLPDKVRDNLAASVPFPKRFGSPAEYAKLVLHIVENPMLNGSVIRLDGALRMAPK
ncbi:MAG TPA: SDR family NAD(P)-dependent oxidoreductase [Gammaproteobacteria bacterium]|nr:SDR family NAD(P)-dependent oxidoreductase [Gammaproteobacteria bacterium]